MTEQVEVPENQHCQKCGQVKDDVDFSSVRGYQFLCDNCLKEDLKQKGGEE